MKAKANHWYEQNKERRTGADGDGKKGNQKVERATFLCIRCSIVYGQVERSRDGGTSVARGSVDGSGSVDDASEATRKRAVACADCGIRVAHGVDGGNGVAEFSNGSCSIDGSGSVDDASEATRHHAVEGTNSGIDFAFCADGVIGVAHGSDDSCSVEGSSSVDDASEAMEPCS